MKNLIYVFFAFLSLTIFSCGTSTPEPLPVSDFTSSVDGKTVTFTNASTDGVSYLWEFGDDNTSAEASPVHTYDGNGSYVVKLTVTNETGTDSKQAVLEIINISIDGDLSEWDDVPVSIAGEGTITSVKIDNLENNKLFLYVEGTTDVTPQTQIILNVDNDNTTGAFIDWWYAGAGEDLLIEGSLTVNPDQYGSIYFCEPCDGSAPGGWNWAAAPNNEDITSFMEASEIISVPGGLAYELAIDLTALGKAVDTEAIGIAVMDVDLGTWAPIGNAPGFVNVDTNPDAAPFIYNFK